MRAIFPEATSAASPGRATADLPVTVQCLEVTAAAAAAYLQESAAQFAAELWSFVASGLSIQAHDRTVFGVQESTSSQHNAGVPMNGEGIKNHSALTMTTLEPIEAGTEKHV